MSTTPDTDEAKTRKSAFEVRKNARADEGRSAMAEYEREQADIAKRTARLKALRLAKEAEAAAEAAGAAKPKPAAAKSKPPAKATSKKKPA